MKKILLFAMVVLVLAAFVACGGTETTTPATTTQGDNTATTTTAADTTVAETTTEDNSSISAPSLYDQGENIMNGDPDYMAIDPFWNGSFPIAFENHHADLDFHWALVIKMQESVESVYEQLIGTNPELEENSSNYVVNNQFVWNVVINGTTYVIDRLSIYTFITSGYVRMDLGEEFEPAEGTQKYDVSLKITDVDSGEIVFWAWFTDPVLIGEFEFEKPAPDVMVPSGTVGENEEALATGKLQGVSGPAGFSSETYTNLFDGEVRKKLCTDDVTTPIVFAITDDVVTFSITSFSIVGANDDSSYTDRVVKSFKLYGAASGDADRSTWELLLDVTDSGETETEVKNYQEYNYKFEEASTYRYYILEVVREAGTYQIGDLVLYAEKGSVTVQ